MHPTNIESVGRADTASLIIGKVWLPSAKQKAAAALNPEGNFPVMTGRINRDMNVTLKAGTRIAFFVNKKREVNANGEAVQDADFNLSMDVSPEVQAAVIASQQAQRVPQAPVAA